MDPVTTFGESILEVLQTGEEQELSAEKKNSFYNEFYNDISSDINEIRERQRRAFDESKKLTLT